MHQPENTLAGTYNMAAISYMRRRPRLSPITSTCLPCLRSNSVPCATVNHWNLCGPAGCSCTPHTSQPRFDGVVNTGTSASALSCAGASRSQGYAVRGLPAPQGWSLAMDLIRSAWSAAAAGCSRDTLVGSMVNPGFSGRQVE